MKQTPRLSEGFRRAKICPRCHSRVDRDLKVCPICLYDFEKEL